ncbi:hypothetical protein, partial [Pontibacter sp. 13R65]|uniref:hypothetical protein n=1 Tax=Pontibacter sp. 13R65 TaxID=3127458 RepID=UPI00301D3E9D
AGGVFIGDIGPVVPVAVDVAVVDHAIGLGLGEAAAHRASCAVSSTIFLRFLERMNSGKALAKKEISVIT